MKANRNGEEKDGVEGGLSLTTVLEITSRYENVNKEGQKCTWKNVGQTDLKANRGNE